MFVRREPQFWSVIFGVLNETWTSQALRTERKNTDAADDRREAWTLSSNRYLT